MHYDDFLKSKVRLANYDGFDIELDEISPLIKKHNRLMVQWLVRGGRRACFARFGLHKTVTQLETVRCTLKRTGGRGLIVCPLNVRAEFINDAINILKWETPPKFIRSIEEAAEEGIYLTNYETIREGKLDPRLFNVSSLDEASILRGFGGSKTFREFMKLYTGDGGPLGNRKGINRVNYRFVATATPSPNEYIELLAYADFLGVMDVSQAKTRFFKRDSTQADKLTLYPHKEEEFWLWVASWALFIQKPSDITGDPADDIGYELEELAPNSPCIHWHEIETDHSTAGMEKDGQYRMLKDNAVGLEGSAKEKRESLTNRVAKVVELRALFPDENRIIWHDLESERHAIEKAIPESVSVYGSQKLEDREDIVVRFTAGEISDLNAKPSMLGSGCNLQKNCGWSIYTGLGFKFNEFIQSIHRIYRYGMKKHRFGADHIRIDLIHTQAERHIVKQLIRKWNQHNELVNKMTEIIKQYGLSHVEMAQHLTRKMGIERIEVKGNSFTAVQTDNVPEAKRLETNSIGLILTSWPFANQYEYSPNYCYDELTEVLTEKGWMSFADVDLSTKVATADLRNGGRLSWQFPTAKIWEPYNGKMLHFVNRNNFDLMVTPDHSMIVNTRLNNGRSGNFKKVSADWISRNFVPRKWAMQNVPAADPFGWDRSIITIPTTITKRKGPKPKDIAAIETKNFMELAGWYLSEGYCDSITSGHAGRITITQTDVNPLYRDQIFNLFNRIGIPGRLEKRAIVGHNIHIATFLINEFGSGSYYKRIPRWIFNLSASLLCILRDTMMKGDGDKTGYAYTSHSPQLRDDFQELCLRTGWRATISGTHVYIGRKQTNPEIREKPSEIEYSGMIGCLKVPNGTLIVRRNGVPVISGNCDFGHSDNTKEFFSQMDYLTPELFRSLIPGRIYALHVKDRIIPGGMNGFGFQTAYPFHVDCILHMIKHGFGYLGMKTIVTDVVRENNQTYRLGWTEQCKDGSKMGVGMPEYLMLFRKPQTDTSKAYSDIPVFKEKKEWSKAEQKWLNENGYSRAKWQIDAHGYTRSNGNRLLAPDEWLNLEHDQIFQRFRDWSLNNVYNFEYHVKLGETLEAAGKLPSGFMLLQPQSWSEEVWTDITRMRTLNGSQWSLGKEMHICPFQLDLVGRVIVQMSNKGDKILDPFAGLFTVPKLAIELERYGIGFELNPTSFLDGVHYCKAAEQQQSTPTLFDLNVA